MERGFIRAVAAGVCALAMSGCMKKTPSQGVVPQPNPQARIATDVRARVRAMGELTKDLAKLAGKLPAENDQQQAKVLHDVFDVVARLLPMLMGPNPDGQFLLQQRIVADARDQLSGRQDWLATAPTVDSGLRATYNALVRVSQESFYTSEMITGGLTGLHERVDALDTVRGPMHRLATAEAVNQVTAVCEEMVRIYRIRLERQEPAPAKPNPQNPAEKARKGSSLLGK